jgi:putative acetyltransferase
MSSPLVRIRSSDDAAEFGELTHVWRRAVLVTHHFLTPEDVSFYEERMPVDYLPAVTLRVATIEENVVGFSGTSEKKLEMLFVDPCHHRMGIGAALVEEALSRIPGLKVDVNEQNPSAIAFYNKQGFIAFSRSETDDEGRPFPIIHLTYSGNDQIRDKHVEVVD